MNYQDKQTPIGEMENSLNEEVVSKLMEQYQEILNQDPEYTAWLERMDEQNKQKLAESAF